MSQNVRATVNRPGDSAIIDANSPTVAGYGLRNTGRVLCLLALPPLLMLGNPSVALLIGGAIVLSVNQRLFSNGSSIGKYCLQAAIVALGFRLDLGTLWDLSASYSWLVAACVVGTLALGLIAGRLLRTDPPSTKLIASGTAICGGTAIASLGTIVRARPDQIAVALAAVFLLNVVALMSFPAFARHLDLTQLQFGLWVALAIHDTSSVVATAALYGDEALAVATTIKVGRTLWLIPLMLALSVWEQRIDRLEGAVGSGRTGVRLRVPGFILLFVAAAAANSLLTLPEQAVIAAGAISKSLLVIALFLIGTELTRATVRQIRGRVLWLALGLWACVVPLTLLAVLWTT
jgi:uncharacterized integral membrane protein (TIGR00698 family)